MAKSETYVAIIHCQISIVEKDPETGECSPSGDMSLALEANNINRTFLATVEGETLDSCLDKLKDKIDGIRE